MAKNKYAILILAAGSSERLGHPKQLVKRGQTTLLNHTIAQAVACRKVDVYLTLGGNEPGISPSITFNIPTIINPNWKDGMGSSISTGLSQINLKNYKAIILSVCDQPYISSDIYNKLITAFEEKNSSIVISKYNKSSGPPTLFSKKHYQDLLDLSGTNGAKTLVFLNKKEVLYIPFFHGDIDIDTKEDIKNLSEFTKLND